MINISALVMVKVKKNMSCKYTSASIMINFKWVAELRNTFITKTVLV